MAMVIVVIIYPRTEEAHITISTYLQGQSKLMSSTGLLLRFLSLALGLLAAWLLRILQ